MEIGQIIKGTVNELLGLNKDISLGRKKICYRCPLFSIKYGGICNDKLWINPKTGDISTEEKDEFIKGCGCRINAKTTLSSAECPIGKW